MPRRRHTTPGKGTFDTDDSTKVKHTKIGVWDFYQDVSTLSPKSQFNWRTKLHIFDNVRKHIPEHYLEAVDSLPYVWQMLRDIAGLQECWVLLFMYLVVELLLSLIPAVSLWYSSQLLSIVESAIETRSVDAYVLLSVAVARIACASMTRLLGSLRLRLSTPLNSRIKLFYNIRLFSAITRLDVPTFADPAVQRQIEYAIPPNSRSSIAWDTVVVTLRMAGAVVQLLSQLSVLVVVLRNQRDGPLLAVLSFGQTLLGRSVGGNHFTGAGVWAATTRNKDYIFTEGLKRTINDPVHRQEIVAGNLGDYLVHQYRTSITRLGEDATDFWSSMMQYRRNKQAFSYISFLQDPLRELPQIVFTFRALTHPRTIPLTLASLNLITSTTQSFTHILIGLLDQFGSVADRLVGVRRLYEVGKIKNMVEDVEERKASPDEHEKVYPQDKSTLSGPLSIEFIHVSFQYPGSTSFALNDVSFKIQSGQLCVILGPNGSGKSTVLKLITRLYDPTDGEIKVNGLNIRDWPLQDLRRVTSVLFQDYTLFPLTIAENITLGGPPAIPPKSEEASSSTNTSGSSSPPLFSTDLILEAARLGGSLPLISRLSGVDKTEADSLLIENAATLQTGLDAYLDRPVKDFYSSLPEGTVNLFGRPVDFKHVRSSGGLGRSGGQAGQGVSGGEMQRIALSRTFMRSLVADPGQDVGLFLFDEPSASLDPKAEHDLFERLRSFRGTKTMLFSSHRFGNLTRHADTILCMEDSVITEQGNHGQLIEKDGEYARVWKLQAQAFLD